MADRPHNCCHRMSMGDTSLEALDADAVEYGFLSAARYFCVSFSEPLGGAWVTAMLGADYFFPGPDSAEKMRRALAVVHEMRTSRRSTFRFSNPRCEGCSSIVTEDERHLLQLVQHARAHRVSMLASSAMLLCEGHATDRVIAAARGFADCVGATTRETIRV
ncbi:hypothetical protein [uncultured Tateyamaria sp.]|uniref:hypothetical protein n=1 Tax=uncultured Tateyamaria sp. TaxID=455651 RepID=UPI0026376463|nr:hypothetical protein [uncultured Tateyamaria sp.]